MTTGRSTVRSGDRWAFVPATLVAAAFVVPSLFLVVASLRAPGEPPPRSPAWWPSDPTLASYAEAFDLVDLGRQLVNSAIVALIATPIAVVSASLAGFVIVRSPRWLARTLIGLAVVAIVVPPSALLVGRFAIYREVGVLDTFVPLVAPALFGVNAIAVLLFAWSYSRLPRALFELAELDDVAPWRTWARIALPLARPMTVAVATIAFAATWSDFLGPLAFITSEQRYTVPLGLRSLQLVGGDDLPVLLAGCAVATLPVVAVFAVTQRWLFASIRGLSA